MYRSSKPRFGLRVVCLGWLMAAASPASGRAETLGEALAGALARNPRIEGARSRSAAAQERVAQARASAYPTVAAHASAGLFSGAAHPSLASGLSTQSLGYDVLASMPLLDGGRSARATDVAIADADAEREGERWTVGQSLLAGISAYTEVTAGRSLVRLNERNVALLRQTVQTTRRQLEAREATRADMAQAEAALAGAEAQLALVRAGLAAGEAAFEEALLHSPGRLEPVPQLEPLLPSSLGAAMALAEAQNASVGAARLRELSARQAIELARAKLWPSISLQAGYQKPETDLTRLDVKGGLVAKVVGTVPLWDGAARAEVRAAGHQLAAAASQTMEIKAQIRTAVAQAWSQMMASRAAMVSLGVHHTAARVALEGIVEERRLGQRTLAEQIMAQQAVINTETVIEQTRRNLYLATAGALLLTGRLEPERVIALASNERSRSKAWSASISRQAR